MSGRTYVRAVAGSPGPPRAGGSRGSAGLCEGGHALLEDSTCLFHLGRPLVELVELALQALQHLAACLQICGGYFAGMGSTPGGEPRDRFAGPPRCTSRPADDCPDRHPDRPPDWPRFQESKIPCLPPRLSGNLGLLEPSRSEAMFAGILAQRAWKLDWSRASPGNDERSADDPAVGCLARLEPELLARPVQGGGGDSRLGGGR